MKSDICILLGIPCGTRGVRVRGMRAGVSLSVTPSDMDRLRALVKDRNAPQKHVWRAQIVALSAEGFGTNAIMRETGKSKTCVWRWRILRPKGSKAFCATRRDPLALPNSIRHYAIFSLDTDP